MMTHSLTIVLDGMVAAMKVAEERVMTREPKEVTADEAMNAVAMKTKAFKGGTPIIIG